MSISIDNSQDTTYISATASSYKHTIEPGDRPTDPLQITSFHHSLPNFNTTPLLSLPGIASSLNISTLLLKCESSRLGLPAFKILGASWGVYRSLCEYLGCEPDPEAFPVNAMRQMIEARENKGEINRVSLFAATDGNHGRAVARMARILLSASAHNNHPRCMIYVPQGMYETTKQLIQGEGAMVVTVSGDYDRAVEECWQACQSTPGGIMVQDNAFDGYDVVPRWIVEGYSTLLSEVDEQFNVMDRVDSKTKITHVVTPIGVGSLGHAVVKWAKDASRKHSVKVITAEPETAGCLNESLRKGESTVIETIDTIMSGMCCGTVSPVSWSTLRNGVDCSVLVSDWEAHKTVVELESHGIEVGPCGAGCLAALRKVTADVRARNALEIDTKSVIVVLCTEGKREYPVPQYPSA